MLADTRESKFAATAPTDTMTRWSGGFWKDVVDQCTSSMVPYLQGMFEAKEISHVLENFRICAGEAQGEFDGSVFGDGDFYKWMESAMYAARMQNDQALEEKLDNYIDLIARAQQPDGYLSTKQIIAEKNGTNCRMGDINDFEVYNMGHLFTAACLYYRLTGKKNFMKVAGKAADYLRNMYDEAEKKGEVKTAVCPSHYMGLIEMYRTTGEVKYLELAQKAVRLRDSVKAGMDDNQDRIPLKKQKKIIGHAVRASYLYAGVADLYAESGDQDYFRVLQDVWNNMMESKIYLTGGIGALYNGTSPYGDFFRDQKIHQAFGYEYQLPNITAYNETCASVGLVLWAYRMFLIKPAAEYFDVIERAMLNVNLAAVSLDGTKYFYENMLQRTKKLAYKLVWPLTRTGYLMSYCCPPNLARTIMESSEYAYTVTQKTQTPMIWLGLYGANDAQFQLKNKVQFQLHQETQYPYDGNIVLTFPQIRKDGAVTIQLRIPQWAKSGSIRITEGKTGREEVLTQKQAGTYYAVQLSSLAESKIELQLDMPVRYTVANPMVEEDFGLIAVEKGPLVYCMESPDVEKASLDEVLLDTSTKWQQEQCMLCGRKIMTLSGTAFLRKISGTQRRSLYHTLQQKPVKKASVNMIPYFAWDNRGMGEMRIWFPYCR